MPHKIYDISIALGSHTPAYPGDPRFHVKKLKSVVPDGYELHQLTLGNHAGTHIDAPAHFIEGGKKISDLPLDLLNGPARVIEISNSEKVDFPDLKHRIKEADIRILIKTSNSSLWKNQNSFQTDYVYLTKDAAKFLAESGVKLVGFDYLSVEKFGDKEYPVHRILLNSEIVILEGLDLSEVKDGEYELLCLPLKLDGLDAAPVRAILRREQ